MTTMREMSLEEAALQYGSTHRAAKEYAALRARVAELERERDKLQDALAITRNACASRKAQRDEYRRMAECAAIMAVCGYFSRMRGPDAWQFMTAGKFPSDEICLIEPTRSRGLYRELYAGSAPVPATQSVDVDAICNAYESGVGHRGRRTANINPYKEGTHEYAAYALGASGDKQNAPVAAVPDGYVLIPNVPCTDTLKRMHVAYWGGQTSNHWHENSEPLWRKTYEAMLAAKAEVGGK